ncbi:MAG TPA: glycosyltransferase [Solirubrobacteraceae bacterium]|nr:glycosyltransferase [Solirubrobacteraceae bacterium]
MHRIFIGYDPSQEVAFEVLRYSLEKHTTEPLQIEAIDAAKLPEFNRPVDPLASTPFTYTRFLVPWLCDYEGIALFMDSDMLALGDISELFHLPMKKFALRVRKHEYTPAETIKMGGKIQTQYPRKNWSSLMLMDCAKLGAWSKSAVETQSGAWLHRFEPIPDEQIGDISPEWNVLDHITGPTKLLHYTSGGPWLPGCENAAHRDLWHIYLEQSGAARATV